MAGEKENRGKARLNTMAKAILELEMPQSCRECPLYKITDICDILSAWYLNKAIEVYKEGN